MLYRWIINEKYKVEVTRSVADRDIPPTSEEMEDIGAIFTIRRAVEAPFLKIPPHMAFDGHHLSRVNVSDVLEASALNQDALDLPWHHREPILKEITKITKEKL